MGALQFVSSARMWLLADGRAWETRDAGSTFVDRTPFEVPPPPTDDSPGTTTGDPDEDPFAVYQAAIAWSLLASPEDVYVLRVNRGNAKTMTLFVSTDDGDSFVARDAPRRPYGKGASLQDGPSGSLLVLRADGGGMNSHSQDILQSFDRGVSFRRIGEKTGYGGITFQSSRIWWTAGSCCASPSALFRSTDAGRTWSLAAGADANSDKGDRSFSALTDAVFLDARRGYRVVSEAEWVGPVTFQRTIDGTRTFQRVDVPPEFGDSFVVLEADKEESILQSFDAAHALVATPDMGASWARLPVAPIALDWATRGPHELVAAGTPPSRDGGSSNPSSVLLRLRDGAGAWEVLTPRWISHPIVSRDR